MDYKNIKTCRNCAHCSKKWNTWEHKTDYYCDVTGHRVQMFNVCDLGEFRGADE